MGTVRDDPLPSDKNREGANMPSFKCAHAEPGPSGGTYRSDLPPLWLQWTANSAKIYKRILSTISTWEPEALSVLFPPQPRWSHPSSQPIWASLPFLWQAALLPPTEGPHIQQDLPRVQGLDTIGFISCTYARSYTLYKERFEGRVLKRARNDIWVAEADPQALRGKI